MKIYSKTAGILALAMTIGSVSSAFAATNNGSFEEGDLPGTAVVVTAPNTTSIESWSVEEGSVDYVGDYWQAADGSRSVELRANEAGVISQVMTTVIGQTYEVHFAIAGNPDADQGMKTVVAAVDDEEIEEFTFDTTGKTRKEMGWEEKTFSFTAKETATKLSFMSGTDSVFGPVIDDVQVEEVEGPTPTSEPTVTPTQVPTVIPTVAPTNIPTVEPTSVPTVMPSVSPMPDVKHHHKVHKVHTKHVSKTVMKQHTVVHHVSWVNSFFKYFVWFH